MAHLYTRIFVNTTSGLDAVVSAVAAAVSGRSELGTVTGMGCELDVRTNDDYSGQSLARDPSDFVYFPFTVEVEAARNNMPVDSYLSVVGRVMEALAISGMQVVAACDWEERLPGRGRLGV